MKYIKLYELFAHGVNYDDTLVPVLKQKVGDLYKLTPYILELSTDGGALSVTDDNGVINIRDKSNTLLKRFNDVDAFLYFCGVAQK